MALRTKFTSVALAGLLAASGITAATATPAAADEICPWPYVCFLDTNENILTMYKDQGAQTTSAKTRTARWVHNARNEDCVLLTHSTGFVDKLYPHQGFGLSTSSPITQINIMYGC
ncbi:hypothetical protein ACGFRB_14090 [Streptomyces sp. NPDC048718]|uniref:hypothetical protein n=1 Tax=Streptomyces sp. NPDC048718 TaxID=3365587 RepID=UPI00371B1A58